MVARPWGGDEDGAARCVGVGVGVGVCMPACGVLPACVGGWVGRSVGWGGWVCVCGVGAVSYTHLTLPTIA